MEERIPGQESKTVKYVSSGSISEGIVGAAAIVLGILGLVGIYPAILVSIATIAIGASFLISGSAIASRFSNLARLAAEGTGGAADFGMGMSAEFLGGISGIALGILALLGIVPGVLIPAAVIVFGGTLVFSSGLSSRLNALELEYGHGSEFAREVARESGSATSSLKLLIGLGVITLGILSLIGIAPVILTLVSVLAIGLSEFLAGTAISLRLLSSVKR